jgi:hypothetical protein
MVELAGYFAHVLLKIKILNPMKIKQFKIRSNIGYPIKIFIYLF